MAEHILLKFTDYVDDFLKGSLYMNTLHYFWYEYRDKAIKKYLDEHPGETRVPITALKDHVPQEDLFEGSVGIGSGPDEKLNEYSLTDTIYRAIGYQYCNVLCLYRLDYKLKMIPGIGLTVHYDVPNMAIKWKLVEKAVADAISFDVTKATFVDQNGTEPTPALTVNAYKAGNAFINQIQSKSPIKQQNPKYP